MKHKKSCGNCNEVMRPYVIAGWNFWECPNCGTLEIRSTLGIEATFPPPPIPGTQMTLGIELLPVYKDVEIAQSFKD